MATTTINLTKSLAISFRQGIKVPKYGCKLSSEHILGTMNNASNDRISNAVSMIGSLSLIKPMIPERFVSISCWHGKLD